MELREAKALHARTLFAATRILRLYAAASIIHVLGICVFTHPESMRMAIVLANRRCLTLLAMALAWHPLLAILADMLTAEQLPCCVTSPW